MQDHTPKLFACLDESSTLEDFTVSSIPWFMCLFAATFDPFVSARLWDFLFLLGSSVLFRVALGILRRVETLLLPSSSDVRAILASVLKSVTELDIETFVEYFELTVTDQIVASLRDRHRQDIDLAHSSPCQLTVRQSLSVDLLSSVREDYFATSAPVPVPALRRSSTAGRRKKIVKEIDAFLGR
jgi:hypothetical protein